MKLQVEKPTGESPIILRSCNCNGYASIVTIGKRESKACWQYNEPTEMGLVTFTEKQMHTHTHLQKVCLAVFLVTSPATTPN